MRTTKRRIDPGVAQELINAPHRFQFFQAVRILQRTFVRQGERPEHAVGQHLRFRNSLALAFPATELAAWSRVYGRDKDIALRGEAIDQALLEGTLDTVELTPCFMGLLGVHGAMPLHYSELLAQREIYERDRAARAFLDVFTTRVVTLHHAAWKKHQAALQYELDQREGFLPLVLSFAGLEGEGVRGTLRQGPGRIGDEAVAYYAGALRQRPISAVMIRRVLAEYFQVSMEITQFVGAWYHIGRGQATRLGGANALLGRSALAGARIWQRDLRVRLRIGPLPRARFDAFLPTGEAAAALGKWLSLLTGACLEYEIRLVLRAEDVRGSRLEAGAGVRLGWDSYLCTGPQRSARDDTTFQIQTLPPGVG